MVRMGARSMWGPKFAAENYSVPMALGVSFHHSVTTTLSKHASILDEVHEMQELEAIGHNRFGYTISYNVVIFPSGRPYQGCPFNLRGQHTDKMNSKVRSICFAGNFEDHEPTPEALKTARDLVAEGRGKWWVRDAYGIGHRDIKATACPGDNVYKHLKYLMSGAKPSKPVPVRPKTPKRVTVNVTMPVVNLANADDKPVRNAAVSLIQTLLVLAGYNVGKAGVDGVGGAHTRAAVGAFQVATGTGTGKRADYIVGERTWEELIEGTLS